MKKNFLFALLLANLLILVSLACSKSSDNSGGGGGGGGTNPTAVSIVGMTYNPTPLTVKVGTVVRWTNTDSAPHTVTSNDGITFSSPTINPGGTFNYTTITPGTFLYHCNFHAGMAGTLTVTP